MRCEVVEVPVPCPVPVPPSRFGRVLLVDFLARKVSGLGWGRFVDSIVDGLTGWVGLMELGEDGVES